MSDPVKQLTDYCLNVRSSIIMTLLFNSCLTILVKRVILYRNSRITLHKTFGIFSRVSVTLSFASSFRFLFRLPCPLG